MRAKATERGKSAGDPWRTRSGTLSRKTPTRAFAGEKLELMEDDVLIPDSSEGRRDGLDADSFGGYGVTTRYAGLGREVEKVHRRESRPIIGVNMGGQAWACGFGGEGGW